MLEEEQEDIDEINRVLLDAAVEDMDPDDQLNIDLAEYDGWPPKKI
jgi:hypothetical protein